MTNYFYWRGLMFSRQLNIEWKLKAKYILLEHFTANEIFSFDASSKVAAKTWISVAFVYCWSHSDLNQVFMYTNAAKIYTVGYNKILSIFFKYWNIFFKLNVLNIFLGGTPKYRFWIYRIRNYWWLICRILKYRLP
jgi:hypothetical protein